MKRHYIVHTHLGDEHTVAKSERGAVNNIRFRLFGTSRDSRVTTYWTVEEVA